MEMMVTAFDVLFRYTVNILKLKRPRNWHTIKFSNAQFKARADCMVGTRNILKLMGYTKPIEAEDGSHSGLSYPSPTQINHDVIKIIGAELLTAKLEVKTAQEQNGFSYPLPMDNVPLDNPHFSQQMMRNPQLDADYYGSVAQPQTQLQPTQTTSSMASSSGNYNSYQMDYPSQYSDTRTLTQHSSYLPPSNEYQPHSGGGGYQHAGGSYGQPSIQPPNQQYSYQNRDQFGYQPNYQSSNQSSELTANFETPPSSLSSSQPSSTEQQPNSGGSGVSSRLAELRRRKEQIIKQTFGNNPPTSGSDTTMPTFTQVPDIPSRPPSIVQRSQVSPSTTAEIQQSNLAPLPTSAPTKTVKPPPVKRRTKFLTVAPSNDEVKYPPSLPEETVIQEQPPPPVQQPEVSRKSTLSRSRSMVECDHCGFPNHERSQECVDCQNPRTERWRKIQLPSSDSGELKQAPTTTTSADANNQPSPDVNSRPHHPGVSNQQYPHQERGAYEPQFKGTTISVDALHDNSQPRQPNVSNQVNQPHPRQEREACGPQFRGTIDAQHSTQRSGDQSSSGPSGASGSSRPLRAYVPVVNYTAEEKEEMRKKAEVEKMLALQQEKGGGADAAPLNSYVPRNDNYNWDEGRAGVRPTGSVLFNEPTDSDNPEDAQMYKSLGIQGCGLIQDIKVHLILACKL